MGADLAKCRESYRLQSELRFQPISSNIDALLLSYAHARATNFSVEAFFSLFAVYSIYGIFGFWKFLPLVVFFCRDPLCEEIFFPPPCGNIPSRANGTANVPLSLLARTGFFGPSAHSLPPQELSPPVIVPSNSRTATSNSYEQTL